MIYEKFSRSRTLSKDEQSGIAPLPEGSDVWRYDNATGQGESGEDTPLTIEGKTCYPPNNTNWKANYPIGMRRLSRTSRLWSDGNTDFYKRYFHGYSVKPLNAIWLDTGVSCFSFQKFYVIQTLPEVGQRCILMTSDPGDLVLDPTCGSGTTATVAEQWGRRWITIDTSRVALALARARIMGARYPYYLLADNPEGKKREAEISRRLSSEAPTRGNIRQGFVYVRVPHVTLKSIANNAEIDVIREKFQETLEPLRARLNATLGESWEEWEIPRDAAEDWPGEAKDAHRDWWAARIARQKEIDASIAARADYDYLFDKPYTDNSRIRVAGSFTVESLAPHRILAVDENDEVFSQLADKKLGYGQSQDFAAMVLEHLTMTGVQQAH